MPELPEVETIARQLAALVAGRTIAGFTSDWVRLTEPEPVRLVAARLAGRRIEAVRRRGKIVVFALDGGDALCTSLRMTGRFAFKELGEAAPERFTRATFAFTDGTALDFVDMRKLGRMSLVDGAEIAADAAGGDRTLKAPLHLAMGREPLGRSFTVTWLRAFLRRRRRAAIKPLLLDQRGIAGIGNIYASEALWRARIHPLRTAGSLKPDEVARLHEAIRQGVVRSCHDLSEGGLAVAVAEMAFAGGVGADVTNPGGRSDPLPDEVLLFSESTTRFVVEVESASALDFEVCLGDVPWARIGETVKEPRLRIAGLGGEWVVWAPLAELKEAWQKPLRW